MLRRTHSKYGSFTTFLALALSVSVCFEVVNGQQITKRVGIVSLYPYQPKNISTLDQLPTGIQVKLKEHLMVRLGREFFSKLEFSNGSVVNFDDLYRVNPGAREYRWRIFAYKIGFAFADRRLGINDCHACHDERA